MIGFDEYEEERTRGLKRRTVKAVKKLKEEEQRGALVTGFERTTGHKQPDRITIFFKIPEE